MLCCLAKLSKEGEGFVIYYDEPRVTIHWDETCQAIWAEWKGYVEGDDYRKAVEAGFVLLRTKRGSRWLADARAIGPLRQIDQDWTNQEMIPRLVGAGLRWMAIVTPKSSIARLSLKKVLNKIREVDLVTVNFDDMEAARAWLRDPTQPLQPSY
jgi:hypothetical protein